MVENASSLNSGDINIENLNDFYVTVKEASRIFKVSKRKIYYLIEKNRVKYKRLECIYVLYQDLAKLFGKCVVIYVRESRNEKKLLNEQILDCIRFSINRGWYIVDIIKHVCAYDLTDRHREKLIELITSRSFDILLATRSDRFTRDSYAFRLLYELCKQNGIEIWTVHEGFIDEDRLEGVLLNLEESFW